MDFRPYVEAESNWDILEAILNGLAIRKGVTVLAWIPAHRGDQGNGRADYLAGVSCFTAQTRWDLLTYQMRLFDFTDPTVQISPHGSSKGRSWQSTA
eukprot:3940368-Rhodomonas_salina.3